MSSSAEPAVRAVLLPGLDGDPGLRTEFVAAMAPEFEVDVVSYPRDVVLDYEGLTALAMERLPRDRPFLLIGESFSGPIAILLASAKPRGLLGLVLCATFAKAPRPLLAPLRHLAGALPPRFLPMTVLMAAMMGRWSTRDWGRRLREAVMSVEPAVLHRRIADAATCDVSARLAGITCPVTYLQAIQDRVIFPGCWARIRDAIPEARCVRIEAPHMLLQARPKECADAIRRLQLDGSA